METRKTVGGPRSSAARRSHRSRAPGGVAGGAVGCPLRSVLGSDSSWRTTSRRRTAWPPRLLPTSRSSTNCFGSGVCIAAWCGGVGDHWP